MSTAEIRLIIRLVRLTLISILLVDPVFTQTLHRLHTPVNKSPHTENHETTPPAQKGDGVLDEDRSYRLERT